MSDISITKIDDLAKVATYLRDRGRCVDGPSGPRQSRRLSIRLMKWAGFFRGLGGRGRRTEDSSAFCDSLPPHSSHFHSWLLCQSVFLYGVFIGRDVTELYLVLVYALLAI